MRKILLKLQTEWLEYYKYVFLLSVCNLEQNVSNFKMLFASLIVQTNVGFLLTALHSCVGRVCLIDLKKMVKIKIVSNQ